MSAPAPSPVRPKAFHVMAKPTGSICNLDCKYCYYLEKEKLYPGSTPHRMSDEVLETFIRDYIAAQEAPVVQFLWHGGEPTLLGLDYFRRITELQKKYAGGKTIENALQTNGTRLDDAWCAFFAENKYLIGLSIDGPKDLHDAYRPTKGGHGSFDKILEGLALLKKHGVEFNTLSVVNNLTVKEPLRVYRFLREIGSGFIQFIPIVERVNFDPTLPLPLAAPVEHGADAGEVRMTPWSVPAAEYGRFLSTIFDEWVRRDVGKVYVQMFDTALASWVGVEPALCVFRKTCGDGLALEFNGDLYSCDHYVYPRWKLGNVMNKALGDMVMSPEQRAFGQKKETTLPRQCRECPVKFACHGECPKHRFMRTAEGEPGLNYLCPSYKHFFAHVDKPMKVMAELLRRERAPAEIMRLYRENLPLAPASLDIAPKAPGRNDPCPCGSGKKFKQCHGA